MGAQNKAEITQAWWTGVMNSRAMNEPKKYPKTPDELWKDKAVKKAASTPDQMAALLNAFAANPQNAPAE